GSIWWRENLARLRVLLSQLRAGLRESPAIPAVQRPGALPAVQLDGHEASAEPVHAGYDAGWLPAGPARLGQDAVPGRVERHQEARGHQRALRRRIAGRRTADGGRRSCRATSADRRLGAL